jgi:hypothetical protein
MIHHLKYRALILSGASATEFAPVMQPLGFTNLYDFVLTTYRATQRDIQRQPSWNALQRHLVLLEAKTMLAQPCFEDSCIEFTRDDVKGFIVGDPARTQKGVYINVYNESQQQFIVLGVLRKAPIQMSDLEELISVLKVGSN